MPFCNLFMGRPSYISDMRELTSHVNKNGFKIRRSKIQHYEMNKFDPSKPYSIVDHNEIKEMSPPTPAVQIPKPTKHRKQRRATSTKVKRQRQQRNEKDRPLKFRSRTPYKTKLCLPSIHIFLYQLFRHIMSSEYNYTLQSSRHRRNSPPCATSIPFIIFLDSFFQEFHLPILHVTTFRSYMI